MDRGIILISLGNPYYAHMAYNLAVSIKYHAPDIPISIVKSQSSINQLFDWQRMIFDSEIELDLSKIKTGENVKYLKTKTLLYELSPYEKTIYLDVDMIWSPYKKIYDLFNLSGLVFACRGEGISEWCELDKLKNAYNINHWYDLSSEFIYFDKSEKNKKFFEDAQKYYDDNIIPVISSKEKKEGKKGITQFANGKPDEVPFGIALEKNNIKIPCPYLPSYWQPHYFTKRFEDKHIQENFYAISAGGANIQVNVKRIYDNLMKYYFYKMGIDKIPYQLIPKSRIIPERRLI